MSSYVLVIRVSEEMDIQVGALGNIRFERGYYMYVGSAKVGISRVCRHFKKDKKLRWHIDYLTSRAEVICAYLFNMEECELSEMLSKRYSGIRGFGCSDCKCETHLYFSREFPVFRTQIILPADCSRFLSNL